MHVDGPHPTGLKLDALTFDTTWWPNWQPDLIGTLVFVVRGKEVLLIEKKTGHGAGKINGPGGKLQQGETIPECAAREVAEEVGLRVENLRCLAELRFVDCIHSSIDGKATKPNKAVTLTPNNQWLGFAFVTQDFSGHVEESVEAKPFWCPITQIPYDKMWADDAIWLPRILSWESRFEISNYYFVDGELKQHEFVNGPAMAEIHPQLF